MLYVFFEPTHAKGEVMDLDMGLGQEAILFVDEQMENKVLLIEAVCLLCCWVIMDGVILPHQ